MSGSLALSGQRITAAWLNLNIPGAFTAIAPGANLANHGGTTPVLQGGLNNSVTGRLIGRIDATAAIASGATIFTIPANLIPTSSQSAVVSDLTSGTSFTIYLFGAGGGGVVQTLAAITSGHSLQLNVFYPLDV